LPLGKELIPIGWVDSRADLDAVAKKKTSDPDGNTIPVVQPIAYLYMLLNELHRL
jgi:hypothetical protein